ncbi:MAG: hypothetical protein WCF98_12020 [Synechococcus sp. ELA057]
MDSVTLKALHRAAPRKRTLKLLKVSLVVLIILLAKVAAHHFGLEPIKSNPLFTSLVASTVFLLGFLLNGVLSDFKESEKLPGELATSLEVLALEIQAISVHSPGAVVADCSALIVELGDSVVAFMLERINAKALFHKVHQCHKLVVKTSTYLKGESPLKGRLMGEMATIIRIINRIDTIRETSFVPLVYWLAYLGTALLTVGLVLMKQESLVEHLFFIAVISFLLLFLIRLIADIDNPFGYSDPDSAEDIALDVLIQTIGRLRELRDGESAPG